MRATVSLALAGLILVFSATVIAAAPVKVFILCGQSNMEGKGAIKHLQQLLADTATAKTYQHLRDDNGWVERDDVFIKYNDDRGQGKLGLGYGTPINRFGPELEFGHVVGNAFDEKVLIIKCAWGGRALAVRFRPPSSGKGDYTQRNRETKEIEPLPEETYGEAYRDTIRIVKQTLAGIDKIVPEYNPADGYELSGFVFFQGFNDIIDQKKMDEYGQNLENLVRDVRQDLDAPKLPFVIGELGQQGVEPEKRYAEKHFAFRKMQEDVSKLPDFKGNVAFVKTSPYIVNDGESFDGGYHYYGRADTFFHIGHAFGEAMVELTKQK